MSKSVSEMRENGCKVEGEMMMSESLSETRENGCEVFGEMMSGSVSETRENGCGKWMKDGVGIDE